MRLRSFCKRTYGLAQKLTPVFCLLIVTGMAIFFDCFWGICLYRQITLANGPLVSGVVTESRIERSEKHVEPYIRYKYAVNRQQYDSDRFSYLGTSSSESGALRAVAANPVGAIVSVHYRPADPSDAVIDTVLHGWDLVMAMYLVSGNAFAVACCSMSLRDLRKPRVPVPRIAAEGRRLRVRLTTLTSLDCLLTVLIICPLFVSLAIGCPTDFDPSMSVAVIGCVVAAVASDYLYHKFAKWSFPAYTDLVIDLAEGLISLPIGMGRKEKITLSLADVTDVTIVERLARPELRYQLGRPKIYCMPTIHFRGAEGEARSEAITVWSSAERAQLFAAWLRGQIGLSGQESTPHVSSAVGIPRSP